MALSRAASRATTFVAETSRVAWEAARRHPFWTAALVPALVLLYVLALVPFTPGIGDLRKAKSENPALVMSADGRELAAFKRANREWMALKDISPQVLAALISTEDHRFYSHHGIDFQRTASALVRTFTGDLQGGSTITQQLARNLYPEEIGRHVSVTRKVREAITALKIEAVYTKDEILETYLNTVPFLYNAWGIEMAARTYFDKSAGTLDELEAATLIGMLKGTSYYNPVMNPERAVQRRNTVLAQMVKHGKLDAPRFAQLKTQPLKIDFERQSEQLGPAPHVTQQLKRWLIEWADRKGYNIYADGLVVHTTIDSRLQEAAVKAVEKQGGKLQPLADAAWKRKLPKGSKAESPLLQAGFLALDPSNGHVKAWVGSRDFLKDQFDHVQQARRQPGSTFKPFVYGAAFEAGMRPTDTLMDAPVEIVIDKGDIWRPSDAGEPSNQPMALRDGLAFSKNTITAQLMQKVGAARVAALARSMGVRQSKLDEVMSLALGTSPVTLREMVVSYSTIANGGTFMEPLLVTRIENRDGKVLETFQARAPERSSLSNATAQTLVDVLRGVIDRGTGVAIRATYGIQADVAGKTGTTQENTDGWFILMHPQLVAGAWVGFNDNRQTMGDAWGQGARSALPIVGEFYQQALRQKVIDAKLRFATPEAPPEPGVLDRVNDWWGSLFPQQAPAEATVTPLPEAAPAAPAPPAEAMVLPAPVPTPLPAPVQAPVQATMQAPPSPQMVIIQRPGAGPQPDRGVRILSVPATPSISEPPAPEAATGSATSQENQ